MDWQEIRALFPATAESAYLDTATYGPGPLPVVRAVLQSLRDWSAGRTDFREWERRGERARELFARLAGVAPEGVALLPAVSVAAGQVAGSLALERGANLVVGESEFRSNLFPWLAQERRGAEVRLVPYRAGRLCAEDVEAAVDERTALVAVSAVQSANGQRVDLERIATACRSAGARLFVDATQAIGALRVPCASCDYAVAAGYKWLLAPRGTAFLYVAPAHRDAPPLFPGWRTPQDPFAGYYGPPYEPAPDASRFDVSIAWQAFAGAEAALELLLDIGAAAIEERALALARAFRAGLAELGLEPAFPDAEASQIVGVAVEDSERVRRSLAERRVVAAVRGGNLRASFHFFNDESDVERALAALAGARGRA